ncbi:uncharacterized protein LOC129596568 [Paramacrobiotus metropolitanus]|uniref:uncharacterized protein LOC129596568 n=1 Tax=Paramacrobiotus metropolitanus TaxID=2943436 RepID=UPI002445DB44|nr:uncharacterized protein LOC129596568 [Paramacrobiotus metropolitanus]
MAQDRRDLADFSAVQCSAPFPVTLRIAPGTSSVLLTASQDFAAELARVQTDVSNGTLTISYTGQFSSAGASAFGGSFAGGAVFASGGSSFSSSTSSSGGESVSIINGVVYRNGQRVDGGDEGGAGGAMPDIRITVTAARFAALTLAGVGSIGNESVSALTEPELEVQLTGTGQLRLSNIQADTVRASLNGTGQMSLSGGATTLSANLQGTGQLEALELPVQDAEVWVAGTGQAKVTVAQRLSGGIQGVGAIGYRGDPQLDVQKSFTGRLYKIP